MANPYVKQIRQRKFVYLGVILMLFTATLAHRSFAIQPLAAELQLSEITRGQVDVTSSAVRLLLTGSRGMAAAFLWVKSISLQDRGEWHELELTVDSITKLQPHFIQPWIWQSWNLAFNVARELDRPYDKYYYVARGINVLAEGEQRNQGTQNFPGHPAMRMEIAHTYQNKIAESDERQAMRCLFDLSVIDPSERDPRRFWDASKPKDRALRKKEFQEFCDRYPRLVRRLVEQLDYTQPKEIHDFLWQNRDVPSRFQEYDWNAPLAVNVSSGTPVKKPYEQFPRLPARPGRDDPHPLTPEKPELVPEISWTNPFAPQSQRFPEKIQESLDVYLVVRSWMYYAMDPLPPSDGWPAPLAPVDLGFKYRIPPRPPVFIFRHFLPRIQASIAEHYQREGWFFREGWEAPESFRLRDERGVQPVFGAKVPYTSLYIWNKAYDMYRTYGLDNGLYFPPEQVRQLNREAEKYRLVSGVPPEARGALLPEHREELERSFLAHLKLYMGRESGWDVNFETWMSRAEAERKPQTIHARSIYFPLKKARKLLDRVAFRKYSDQFWPLWEQVVLDNPRFMLSTVLMEDFVDDYQVYMKFLQPDHRAEFEALALGFAQMATGVPLSASLETIKDGKKTSRPFVDEEQRARIVPFKHYYGPWEMMQYFDFGEEETASVRAFMAVWPQLPGNPIGPLGYASWVFTKQARRDEPLARRWQHVVPDLIVNPVHERRASRIR